MTLPLISDPDRVREALERLPVPAAPPATSGVAWLRAHVARFCDGPIHQRRRALALAELERLAPSALREQARVAAGGDLPHVRVLADALGLTDIPVSAVALVAAQYQPHEPGSAEADAAVTELIERCGGSADERTAARLGLLVQACQATASLIGAATARRGIGTAEEIVPRALDDDPPVRRTRRILDGHPVELDLTGEGLAFGAGPHACPGRPHALALAAGVVEGLE